MSRPHLPPHLRAVFGIAASIALSACGGDGDDVPAVPVATPAEACAKLAGVSIPGSAIGLPTSGARVAAASLVAATATLPEYCKVTGAIAPADVLNGLDINFQVNLPSNWNGKAMHFGGSGYNGSVATATGAAPSAPPDVPVPLARGYATFGSDSGHTGGNAQFAVSDEALVNFGYAQMKKTRDVAMELIRQRFAQAPTRTYWVGSSQGGREGLTVAQRFPADYDGVLARVPVLSFTGLQLQGNRFAQAIGQPGGWLNLNKVNLLQQAVLNACDAADGLADGTIANFPACNFDAATLRCPGGADTGDGCLSDAQLNTVNTLHTPMAFGATVANGITAYPGWNWGAENNPAGNWTSWVTGTGPAGGNIANFGNQYVQYFVAKNAPGFNPLTFNPADPAWRTRLMQISNVVDGTNPDLSAFQARGGKLIIQEHGGDYARSPIATIQYYNAVIGKMGQTTANGFLRMYLTPGAEHGGVGGTGWPATSIDWVAALEAWVENNQAPGDKLSVVKKDTTAPFATTATRPLCRFPTWPKYNGSGDVNAPASFSCVSPS